MSRKADYKTFLLSQLNSLVRVEKIQIDRRTKGKTRIRVYTLEHTSMPNLIKVSQLHYRIQRVNFYKGGFTLVFDSPYCKLRKPRKSLNNPRLFYLQGQSLKVLGIGDTVHIPKYSSIFGKLFVFLKEKAEGWSLYCKEKKRRVTFTHENLGQEILEYV